MPGRVYTGQRNYLIVNDKSSPATVGNKGSSVRIRPSRRRSEG